MPNLHIKQVRYTFDIEAPTPKKPTDPSSMLSKDNNPSISSLVQSVRRFGQKVVGIAL